MKRLAILASISILSSIFLFSAKADADNGSCYLLTNSIYGSACQNSCNSQYNTCIANCESANSGPSGLFGIFLGTCMQGCLNTNTACYACCIPDPTLPAPTPTPAPAPIVLPPTTPTPAPAPAPIVVLPPTPSPITYPTPIALPTTYNPIPYTYTVCTLIGGSLTGTCQCTCAGSLDGTYPLKQCTLNAGGLIGYATTCITGGPGSYNGGTQGGTGYIGMSCNCPNPS